MANSASYVSTHAEDVLKLEKTYGALTSSEVQSITSHKSLYDCLGLLPDHLKEVSTKIAENPQQILITESNWLKDEKRFIDAYNIKFHLDQSGFFHRFWTKVKFYSGHHFYSVRRKGCELTDKIRHTLNELVQDVQKLEANQLDPQNGKLKLKRVQVLEQCYQHLVSSVEGHEKAELKAISECNWLARKIIQAVRWIFNKFTRSYKIEHNLPIFENAKQAIKTKYGFGDTVFEDIANDAKVFEEQKKAAAVGIEIGSFTIKEGTADKRIHVRCKELGEYNGRRDTHRVIALENEQNEQIASLSVSRRYRGYDRKVYLDDTSRENESKWFIHCNIKFPMGFTSATGDNPLARKLVQLVVELLMREKTRMAKVELVYSQTDFFCAGGFSIDIGHRASDPKKIKERKTPEEDSSHTEALEFIEAARKQGRIFPIEQDRSGRWGVLWKYPGSARGDNGTQFYNAFGDCEVRFSLPPSENSTWEKIIAAEGAILTCDTLPDFPKVASMGVSLESD